MKSFSRAWNSSKKRRKQRKFRYNAPLHIRKKFVASHLSRELRKKYAARSIGLRKGDKVKVMRGKFRDHQGEVMDISLAKGKVQVAGVEMTKKEGSKVPVLIDPSNLLIIEMVLEDKKRQQALERKMKHE
ncbi:50S ribosomal protein L24 [Candidatus Woesearchaeota archaeon]|nr:50S ribosomal protein L24 [Candidatus Woesearchaeota archaeon]